MSDRIQDLATLVGIEAPKLVEEAREQINESINAIMEESQESETGKAVLSLTITAKWDLGSNSVVVSMPVNVKRRFERVAKMEDPAQQKLPLEGGAA